MNSFKYLIFQGSLYVSVYIHSIFGSTGNFVGYIQQSIDCYPVEEFPLRVPTGKKKDQTMKTFLY
jgi:hypothetical protein